jgi:hypothetical protein
VVGRQQALAVPEDRVRALDDRIRLQAAVLLGNAHRAAGDRHPHAEGLRLLDLDVDRVLEARREQIVVVGRGRASRHQEFDERHADCEPERVRRHPIPQPLHRHQPGNEVLALARRVGAGQRLIEMVVGIDEPRQHDMAGGVERRPARRGRRVSARDALGDLRAVDDDPALGFGRQDRERVLDPDSHGANSRLIVFEALRL